MKKISQFKAVAETILNGKIKNVSLGTPCLNTKRLSVDEVKKIMQEEFAKAKEVCDTKAKEVDYWGDADLENEINWMKALNIKEFFDKK